MKCQACKQDMMVIGNVFSSPKTSEEVSVQLQYGCRNPKCTEFAGNKQEKTDKIKLDSKKKVN